MTFRTKRVLTWGGVIVLLLVLGFIGALGSAFLGTSAIQDGAQPDPSVRIVKDGPVVSVGFIDVGGGKIALIDGGVDTDAKAVLAELARRKLEPDAVTAVFLTHGHVDHLGGCRAFPRASIYVLAADIPLAEGAHGLFEPPRSSDGRELDARGDHARPRGWRDRRCRRRPRARFRDPGAHGRKRGVPRQRSSLPRR